MDLAGLENLRPRLEAICRRRGVRTLAVFGSVVRGTSCAGSDVDVLVAFQPMEPAVRADSYFALLADLEELLNTPVDLVEADAIRNPYFRAEILQTQMLLFDAA